MLEIFEGLPEGTLCELINNNIVMSPSPNFEHQLLAKRIFRQLDNHVEKQNAGEVIFAPMDVYLGKRNVYQPDIFFIKKDRLGIVKDGKVKGAPDLIIEILSAATAKYDLEDKKKIYELFRVKEYWIIDPVSKTAKGYALSNKEYK
ncbi:MAG: Uma2 family endonuclease, partial [Bacteroidota bacterium]